MRTALVLTLTALLARGASAQPGPSPVPVPPPGPPAGDPPPQPTAPDAAPPGAPGQTVPVEPAEPAPPKVDPAYGDRPDTRTNDPAASDMPGIRRGRDIVVRYRPDRSKKNMVTTGLIGGAAVVFGAIGLYFNLEARSAADEVSALKFTGRAWTPEREARYDDAYRNSTIAGVMYGVGGALLLTTAIYYIVTEPPQQELVITPNSRRASARTKPLVAPTRGGALVGGAWSF